MKVKTGSIVINVVVVLTIISIPLMSSSLAMRSITARSSSPSSSSEDDNKQSGRLEHLKKKEAKLSELLASIRQEKLSLLRNRPLTIGIIGFGRFGQFIARTFAKYGNVVVTSRSDYTQIAEGMGVTYVPLSDLDAFVGKKLDVIVVSVSITSFEPTIRQLVPFLQKSIEREQSGPLIVDVLSVKEHPRRVMLDLLPPECDILCTHPMFGPDSGKNGWHGLNFVYERSRIDGVAIDPDFDKTFHQLSEAEEHPFDDGIDESFMDIDGQVHMLHEANEAHVQGMDRIERFLSIWEEEGCRMVPMSCKAHDQFSANSQFITHLMGRILGSQGLKPTPIDTRGFESVLKLISNTMADSFDLFYGLYKYNKNSMEVIFQLKEALENVTDQLNNMDLLDKSQNQENATSLNPISTQHTQEKNPHSNCTTKL